MALKAIKLKKNMNKTKYYKKRIKKKAVRLNKKRDKLKRVITFRIRPRFIKIFLVQVVMIFPLTTGNKELPLLKERLSTQKN